MNTAHENLFSHFHDRPGDGRDVARSVRSIRLLPLPIILLQHLLLINLLLLIIY